MGRAVRASRIQFQPHRGRTLTGSACQAFRIGSRAFFLARRAGSTRPSIAWRSSWKKRATGFGSGA